MSASSFNTIVLLPTTPEAFDRHYGATPEGVESEHEEERHIKTPRKPSQFQNKFLSWSDELYRFGLEAIKHAKSYAPPSLPRATISARCYQYPVFPIFTSTERPEKPTKTAVKESSETDAESWESLFTDDESPETDVKDEGKSPAENDFNKNFPGLKEAEYKKWEKHFPAKASSSLNLRNLKILIPCHGSAFGIGGNETGPARQDPELFSNMVLGVLKKIIDQQESITKIDSIAIRFLSCNSGTPCLGTEFDAYKKLSQLTEERTKLNLKTGAKSKNRKNKGKAKKPPGSFDKSPTNIEELQRIEKSFLSSFAGRFTTSLIGALNDDPKIKELLEPARISVSGVAGFYQHFSGDRVLAYSDPDCRGSGTPLNDALVSFTKDATNNFEAPLNIAIPKKILSIKPTWLHPLEIWKKPVRPSHPRTYERVDPSTYERTKMNTILPELMACVKQYKEREKQYKEREKQYRARVKQHNDITASFPLKLYQFRELRLERYLEGVVPDDDEMMQYFTETPLPLEPPTPALPPPLAIATTAENTENIPPEAINTPTATTTPTAEATVKTTTEGKTPV